MAAMDMQRDNEHPIALLRAATRTAHRKVESHALMRPLVTGTGLDRDYYQQLLLLFYRYYRVLECHLLRHAPQVMERDPYSDYCYRLRAPMLKADLDDLGVSVASLPDVACAPLPSLQDTSAPWGVLYVIEGATRGGRVIAPRLSRSLGAGPDWAGRFFSLDVDDVREAHWTAFCNRLRRAASDVNDAPDRRQAMIDAARQTFDSLYTSLERHRVPA